MEGMVSRLVGEVIGGLGVRGSWGSLAPPLTPAVDQPVAMGIAPLRAPKDPGPETGPEEVKKKKRKKKKKKVSALVSPPQVQTPLPPSGGGRDRALDAGERGTDGPSWAKVVGRKRKTEGGERGGPPTQRPPNLARRMPESGGGRPPLPPRRGGGRAPSTAAITITASDGTYAEVMRRAKEHIGTEKLRSLGIDDMRARRGRTGAYVLEIPGKKKEERELRAEALAKEMREVFADNPDVRIARPMAVVRVRDLDEAVAASEVVAAFVSKGAVESEVRVSITRPPNGMGVAWVRCPVIVADEVLKAGRIKVGWTTVRVGKVAARPSHCFKCWGGGM